MTDAEFVPTRQKVTILVEEGEKTYKLEREQINAWPGRKTPHIVELMHAVTNEAVAEIITRELQATESGA